MKNLIEKYGKDELLNNINDAFSNPLYDWQVDFIFEDNSEIIKDKPVASGKSLARCIKCIVYNNVNYLIEDIMPESMELFKKYGIYEEVKRLLKVDQYECYNNVYYMLEKYSKIKLPKKITFDDFKKATFQVLGIKEKSLV